MTHYDRTHPDIHPQGRLRDGLFHSGDGHFCLAEYMNQRIENHVSGIPCLIDYTIHGRYRPAKTNADPDYCYEAEYPEIEYTVLDRKGYPAAWLAKKITPHESERIENEIMEYQNE